MRMLNVKGSHICFTELLGDVLVWYYYRVGGLRCYIVFTMQKIRVGEMVNKVLAKTATDAPGLHP